MINRWFSHLFIRRDRSPQVVETLSIVSLAVITVTIIVLLSRRYEVTYVLVLSNLLVFFISIISAATTPGAFGWVQYELGFRPAYLQSGESVHTLLTHMFVHASFMHVVMNMLFLFLIGTQLEQRVGRSKMISVYFVGGFIALLTESMLQWSPDSGFSAVLMVGASGAVSALMGAMLLLYPNDEIPFFLGPIFMQRVKVWLSVGTWFLLQAFLLLAGTDMGVAYGAHIGGFLGGALIARVVVEGQDIKSEGVKLELLWEYAKDPRAATALERVMSADEEDVRQAWLEEFVEHATCPRCGEKPELRGNKLKCPCGSELRLR